MSGPTRTSEFVAPKVQGLDLFEHYEANGNLLIVTSDRSIIKPEPGDRVIRRPWATSAPPVERRTWVAVPRIEGELT